MNTGECCSCVPAATPECSSVAQSDSDADYYGQSPGQVRVYQAGDILVVLIEETFTRAEQTLIGRGEADEVQVIRRRFQVAIADQFRAIVQTASGCFVRAFLSDTNLHEHLAVETFVLGEPVEDMAGFEREVGASRRRPGNQRAIRARARVQAPRKLNRSILREPSATPTPRRASA